MTPFGDGERFAGLLLRCRGRTHFTQSQLASRTGVHMRSLQSWEAGVSYPSADRLQALISAFLETGGLAPGRETTEAEGLWEAALREAPRMAVPFDPEWFHVLLTGRSSAAGGATYPIKRAPAAHLHTVEAAAGAAHREDWADAPDVSRVVGRIPELETLRQWLVGQQYQVVQLAGMGGIGKTTLATLLARDVASEYDLVYWRSLKFAPSAYDWLAGAIDFITDGAMVAPDREDECIALLIKLLRERRCLLVLDNLETLLEPHDSLGRFQDSFSGYRALLQTVAETRHQSCLILTSREASADLGMMSGGSVASLEVRGLSVADTQVLLLDKQLTGTELDWTDFVARCGGNALVMKMTGETVRQIFGSQIGTFLLAVGSNGAIHGGVRRLLASQLDQRLSEVERAIVQLLAASGEPLTPAMLMAELAPRMGRPAVIEALQALRRRSLIERSDSDSSGFNLHPVVRDYVAVQLLQDVAA
jgi:transcriptional regulator with XRE-family HTH domain